MLVIVATMIVILAAAAGVVVYVAYPGRGETVPKAPWLGKALDRAVERFPTLDESEQRR